MADVVEQADIRGINVDSAVKGFASEKYKLKQVCLVQNSNKWREDYYKETKTVLTGHTVGHNVKGVPRLAEFPYLEAEWTLTSSYHVKHAGAGVVSHEDEISNAIDTIARQSFKIAEAIAYSVDRAIYAAITADADVNTAAATATWDDASAANRDPIRDILVGIQYMAVDNYEEDYTHLLMNSKVINNPSFKTADVVSNGVVGQVCGLKIIVSNAVDADEACILIGQLAVTFKQLEPLKVAIEDHPGIKKVISAWEIGVTQIVNPEAIHIITNTQA